MFLRYLFIDFDSFFASVEQQNDPKLREKPVGVVPSLGVNTTCCIAASYEAKRFGVKTGTGVWEAKKMCPGIVFVEAGHTSYVKMHNRMIDVIEKCIHVEKVMSIDECFCLVPSHWQTEEMIRQKCVEIRTALREEIGGCITCSIGLGPNRFLGKVASSMRKPNGLQIIRRSDLPEILYSLSIEDLNGVGLGMSKRLKARGISTVEQMCNASEARLVSAWGGILGTNMYHKLRGHDVVPPETTRRSVSHSHVLAPVMRNHQGALAVLHKQLQKACRRLRAMHYFAARMAVYVKFGFTIRWEREARFFPTQDTLTFANTINQMWEDAPREEPPTKVSVVLSDLVAEAFHTKSLFEEDNHDRRVNLQKAMDRLNLSYGNRSVYYASAYQAHQNKEAAPMRISFTHIPNIELERDD